MTPREVLFEAISKHPLDDYRAADAALADHADVLLKIAGCAAPLPPAGVG